MMTKPSQLSKAKGFYQIQDATAFDIPVDSASDFYIDFSPYRNNFTNKVFRHLNINPDRKSNNDQCNPLTSDKKIFLTGYRGTGKTSELLTLKKQINKTKCYLVVFVDLQQEELDMMNIDTVDILILMLEKLITELDLHNIDVNSETIIDFCQWFQSTIITEANEVTQESSSVELDAAAGFSLSGFLKMTTDFKTKLQSSKEEKETIIKKVNRNFNTFATKFNEFSKSIIAQFEKSHGYKDLLFIIDGFEKIGELAKKEKILIEDSNKFALIKSHMIIALPIELFTQRNKLTHFSTTENFPLIDLKKEGAKEALKQFILKRIDQSLFDNEQVIDKIIKFGAGHPRQTLKLITQAYLESTTNKIDDDSVAQAIISYGENISGINAEELEVVKKVDAKKDVLESNVFTELKGKDIVFEYGAEKPIINPIVAQNEKFKRLLKQ